MSTPLGLSVGRLLQSLFPPLPEFVGRQVVAVHNSRDFIFFRRFRYQFSLREDELSVQRAKERGLDTLVRARMQELGPRLTLKLRWIKRGTLASGRRRANGTLIGADEEDDSDMKDEHPEAAAVIDDDAAQDLADEVPLLTQSSVELPQPVEGHPVASTSSSAAEPLLSPDQAPVEPKRKRRKASPDSKVFKIPRPQVPTLDLESNQHHRRKRPKPGASILDSVNLQGGVRDSEKEWAWQAKMQVKKNRFAL
jgi:ribosome production factor 1